MARRFGSGSLGERPEGSGLPNPTVLVGLQPGGSRPPLFLVHPHSGELFLYRHLVAALGPEQPVYGFQAVGFATDDEPLTAVEAMAAVYVDALLSFQPRGLYLLAGSSLGGLIAFEMAAPLPLPRAGGGVPGAARRARPRPASVVAGGYRGGDAELSILRQVVPGGPPCRSSPARAGARGAPGLVLELGHDAGTLAAAFGLRELARLVRVVEANRGRPAPSAPPLGYLEPGLHLKAAENPLGMMPPGADLRSGRRRGPYGPGGHLSMQAPPHAEALAARLLGGIGSALRVPQEAPEAGSEKP